MLYDYPTLETENDKTLSEIHAFIDRLSIAAVPGAYLVDVFPWMMHIPERFVVVSMTYSFLLVICYRVRFARWKAEGRRYFEHDNIMFQTLLHHDRSDMVGTDTN